MTNFCSLSKWISIKCICQLYIISLEIRKNLKLRFPLPSVYIFMGENFELFHFCETMDMYGLLENGEYVVVFVNIRIPTYSDMKGLEGGKP